MAGMIKKLFNKLRENQKAWIFFVCIILSAIFWVFTSLSRQYETRISFPVSYRNIPFSHFSNNNLPSHINFHFKGSGFELFRVHLRKRPDSIQVDVARLLGTLKAMDFPTITLRNQFPGDQKAYRTSPETIPLSFTPRNVKRVPVVAVYNVTFKNQFGQQGNLILRPDSVDLSGPADLISKVNSVSTRPIQLKNVSKSTFQGIQINTEGLKGISLSQPYVYYYLPVEQYTEGILELPVELPVSQRSRVTLFPPKVKISFLVAINNFKNVGPGDFQVIAEVPFPEIPSELNVKLKRFPRGIHGVKIQPETVNYLIKE